MPQATIIREQITASLEERIRCLTIIVDKISTSSPNLNFRIGKNILIRRIKKLKVIHSSIVSKTKVIEEVEPNDPKTIKLEIESLETLKKWIPGGTPNPEAKVARAEIVEMIKDLEASK